MYYKKILSAIDIVESVLQGRPWNPWLIISALPDLPDTNLVKALVLTWYMHKVFNFTFFFYLSFVFNELCNIIIKFFLCCNT